MPPSQLITLGWCQVCLLLVLAVAVVALSAALRLGLVREFSIATTRSIVQLAAIGLIIGWVFDHRTWYWVLGVLLVMLLKNFVVYYFMTFDFT